MIIYLYKKIPEPYCLVKIRLLENLAKQFILIAQGILKLDDSQRRILRGYIITYIRVGDVSQRFTHKAKAGEVTLLVLDLLKLF
jgi:hypothetical protein